MNTNQPTPPRTLRDWQVIRYGDSDETRAALAYYRERGWNVDDQDAMDIDGRIYAFKSGYLSALLTPETPLCDQMCPHGIALDRACVDCGPAPVTPEPPRPTDAAYLIERYAGPQLVYWTGRKGEDFSADVNWAVRFSRYEDTEQVRGHVVPQGETCRSVQHAWMPALEARPTTDKGGQE